MRVSQSFSKSEAQGQYREHYYLVEQLLRTAATSAFPVLLSSKIRVAACCMRCMRELSVKLPVQVPVLKLERALAAAGLVKQRTRAHYIEKAAAL